jgi:hypothetical protein
VAHTIYKIIYNVFSLIISLIIFITLPYMCFLLFNKMTGKDKVSKITLSMFDKKIIFK